MRNKKYLIFLILLILGLILVLPSKDIQQVNLKNTFMLSSFNNLMGTDNLGRDVFSLVKAGLLRTIVVIAISSSISLVLGVVVGVISGFYEGYIEKVLRSIIDLLMVVPSLMAALIFVGIFGLSPVSCGIIFGITGIGDYAYQAMALSKSLKKEEFIDNMKIMGLPDYLIILKGIIPNISTGILNVFSSKGSNVILQYSSLAFMGLGVDITNPDWGTLLYSYRSYVIEYPFLIIYPTLGIFLLSILFYLLFDQNQGEIIYKRNMNKVKNNDVSLLNEEAVLSVSGLNMYVNSKNTQNQLLKNISLNIKQGERVGLVGQSGCGKTMLISSITNTIKNPNIFVEGNIMIKGHSENILNSNKKEKIIRENIGVILQDSLNGLNPYIKISKQLEETLRIKKNISKENMMDYLKEPLEMIGLSGRYEDIDKYPHEFSGGMCQRIVALLSLIGDIKLLICDEPTTALDSINQNKLNNFIKTYCEKENIAILYISHNFGVVSSLCNRIMIIKDGEIIEENFSDKIKEESKYEYTKDLIKNSKLLLESYKRKKDDENITNINLLNIKDVNKVYKNNNHKKEKGIYDINVSLLKGEVLGVLGESGSGKSTFAKVVVGLLKKDSGNIVFNNEILNNLKRNYKTHEIQMVFQNPSKSFSPKDKIIDSIKRAPLYHNIYENNEQLNEELESILKKANLDKQLLDRYPSELSGGQLQRMAIVGSLLLKPKLLIADEILASLDVTTSISILDMLLELKKEYGLSILFITHDISVAIYISDKIIVMKDGFIIEECLSKDLKTKATTKYTKELIDSIVLI